MGRSFSRARRGFGPRERRARFDRAGAAVAAYAGEVEGRGRGEDEIAFLREHGEYLNAILVEQPNGDFGHTIVRQVLIDAFQLELYQRMATSTDERLAAIAAKSVKEVLYHLRYSGGWLVRLGDGTEESHARVQSALDTLWPYTVELFAEDELDRMMADRGVAPRLSDVTWRGSDVSTRYWPSRRSGDPKIDRIPARQTRAAQ